MEAITDRFRAAVVGAHATTVRVEVLPGGDATQTIDISPYFADGSLTVSRQAIRRAGSITFVDRDESGLIVPTDPGSLLAPFGNQLRVWSGFDYGDGTEELVPVGTFRITKSAARGKQCTVELSDRAWIVSNAALTAPYQIAQGTPWDVAALTLLGDRYPGVDVDIPSVEFDTTTPRITLDQKSDPWERLQAMFAAIGYAFYFTPLGTATVANEVALAAADEVWIFDGTPVAALPADPSDWANLALYDEELTWDSEPAYNAVGISGNSSSVATPAFGLATDTDPHSPTQYGGPFGRKPLFEDSELVTTNGQAVRAAQARLQQVAGLAESLQIPAIPNPALEVGDMVGTIRPELGINTSHMLDTIPVPLRGGNQLLGTRIRRVVVSGDA